MCVLAFAWRAHPRWRLVAAGNRDESHARPAQALARWNRPDHLLAGIDMQSGGTWLGVSDRGRFAVVTNLRGYGPPEPGSPSRGLLVRDLLAGDGDHAQLDRADDPDFAPFNLLFIDRKQASLISNRPNFVRRQVEPGIYGLSNGGLDEAWPKTMRLQEVLHEWISREDTAPGLLLDHLREDALPGAALSSPDHGAVPHDPAISPIFIRNQVYGTRCSTVVTIDASGAGLIIERRFTPQGDAAGETVLTFSWPH